MIDSNVVSGIVVDSLFTPEELGPDRVVPDDAIMVEGVVRTFGFHPGRLEQHRDQVSRLLSQLNHTFRVSSQGGQGGWSFLNAPMDENGNIWGEQDNAEELLCLGEALGMVRNLLPREVWQALPGGVPYYSIDLEGTRESQKSTTS